MAGLISMNIRGGLELGTFGQDTIRFCIVAGSPPVEIQSVRFCGLFRQMEGSPRASIIAQPPEFRRSQQGLRRNELVPSHSGPYRCPSWKWVRRMCAWFSIDPKVLKIK